jgi:hypothetical protein
MKDIDQFIRQVKFNCDISDAKFWGYYSICGLLMRYRDLYRSEHALMPWDCIRHEDISSWIHERESLWKELEESDLQKVVINGLSCDPFDVNSINAALQEKEFIYGAGYGTFSKPTFFVAKLESVRENYDYRVYSAGKELCRDLAAAPAMLQGRCIYLRPDVISSFLWDRFEEMRSSRGGCFAEEVFSMYGIGRKDLWSTELFGKIIQMVSDAAGIFLLHETGEAYEDNYSEDWLEILSCSCDKATELYLRAIKDIRADTSVMGPLKKIIETRDLKGIHLSLLFMDGIRREIFPEFRSSLQQFPSSEAWSALETARKSAYERTDGFQSAIVSVWRRKKDSAEIAACIREIVRKKSP